jgi:CheY-like chemotaxis protein
LLDIGLPGMDGYAVANAIRQLSKLQGTLLLAVTGYGQPEDVEKSRRAGFDNHLVKPIDYAILRRLLADYQTVAPVCLLDIQRLTAGRLLAPFAKVRDK